MHTFLRDGRLTGLGTASFAEDLVRCTSKHRADVSVWCSTSCAPRGASFRPMEGAV